MPCRRAGTRSLAKRDRLLSDERAYSSRNWKSSGTGLLPMGSTNWSSLHLREPAVGRGPIATQIQRVLNRWNPIPQLEGFVADLPLALIPIIAALWGPFRQARAPQGQIVPGAHRRSEKFKPPTGQRARPP